MSDCAAPRCEEMLIDVDSLATQFIDVPYSPLFRD